MDFLCVLPVFRRVYYDLPDHAINGFTRNTTEDTKETKRKAGIN